jgi:hypothetical protein
VAGITAVYRHVQLVSVCFFVPQSVSLLYYIVNPNESGLYHPLRIFKCVFHLYKVNRSLKIKGTHMMYISLNYNEVVI